jgi:hypothetical protein
MLEGSQKLQHVSARQPLAVRIACAQQAHLRPSAKSLFFQQERWLLDLVNEPRSGDQ